MDFTIMNPLNVKLKCDAHSLTHTLSTGFVLCLSVVM